MKKLEVRLVTEPGVERLVGQLAETGRQIYFEYDPVFLQDPLWLSPFKLPPEPGLHQHRDYAFGPIFGLFDDSLPDGWGLLLMDRFFKQRENVLTTVSVLDRLAYLGTRTMGALTYHPPSEPADRHPQTLDLYEMARASEHVLHGSSQDVLPQLLRAGGSPGGARPKVLVGISGEHMVSGEADIPPGYSSWIVKFNAVEDPPDAGPIELAYALMAADGGINMPPTRLFETVQSGRFFGIERFDREANRRYHVHTFGNLIHSNFRIPNSDYEQLLKVTQVLTRNHQDVLECFRRMVFNVLAHNRDDHVKNFAFRLGDEGEWELAPAYDLVFALGPGGEHTMTVAGEGKSPGRRHMLQLAGHVSIAPRDADSIIDEVVAAVERWQIHAGQAQVGRKSIQAIGKAIEDCLARI